MSLLTAVPYAGLDCIATGLLAAVKVTSYTSCDYSAVHTISFIAGITLLFYYQVGVGVAILAGIIAL